ncbi:hypothetical protein C5167_041879 [Papaver somniferum]|nr:hypothetical protein C5167_041879 [Papaver somniferum]
MNVSEMKHCQFLGLPTDIAIVLELYYYSYKHPFASCTYYSECTTSCKLLTEDPCSSMVAPAKFFLVLDILLG